YVGEKFLCGNTLDRYYVRLPFENLIDDYFDKLIDFYSVAVRIDYVSYFVFFVLRYDGNRGVVAAFFSEGHIDAYRNRIFIMRKLFRRMYGIPIRKFRRIKYHRIFVYRIIHILRIKRLRAVIPLPRH